MTRTMIEATEIAMALGEGAARVEALKGINLSLKGGELTLLMGPSGSGKTTLLSVLGCMLSPTGGTVQIRGRSITGLNAEQLAEVRRENVGFVFQSYHLFPTLTAAENVRLALDVRGDRSLEAREKANKALATVGLAHKTNAFPRALSGGEQQRVWRRGGRDCHAPQRREPLLSRTLGPRSRGGRTAAAPDRHRPRRDRRNSSAAEDGGDSPGGHGVGQPGSGRMAHMAVGDRIELLKSNILHFTRNLLRFDVVEVRIVDQKTGR